jgi:hypothetical protein
VASQLWQKYVSHWDLILTISAYPVRLSRRKAKLNVRMVTIPIFLGPGRYPADLGAVILVDDLAGVKSRTAPRPDASGSPCTVSSASNPRIL